MSDPQPRVKILPMRPRAAASPGEPVEHRVGRTLLENLSSLYATAVRLTGLRDLAEDLVQETARKALDAAPQLEHQRNVRGWVFAILVNLIRDRARRRHDWEELDAEAQERSAEQPETESIRRATAEDVRRALQTLEPARRAVLTLIDIEGFTLREAAEILGISSGTAASRLWRARHELRDLLQGYENLGVRR